MNLTQTILPQLESQKLNGLSLAPEFIAPNYHGTSIANLSSQVAQWLGAPPFAVSPLDQAIAGNFGDGSRRVIMVLMDAMGYQRFQPMLTESNSVWNRLASHGIFSPLTSVFPSTTSAALTSIWSGHAPGEHGMLGYEMWLKEYGTIGNMINFSPMSVSNEESEMLFLAGFDPEKFLAMPTLGKHLEAAGIETHGFMPGHLMRSGLSKMHMSSVKMHGYLSPNELWQTLHEFLNTPPNQKQFIWIYFSNVDTLAHKYGPAAEVVEWEARLFGEVMQRMFLDRLSAAARRETVLMIAADHGQVDTPRRDEFNLSAHRSFTEMLHILPNGENRAAYLHCRPAHLADAKKYVAQTWGDQFQVVSQAEALAAGLYGQNLDAKTISRLGEWLVLSKAGAYLWWADKENKMLGRHGGLAREEMLVPLVAGRLDHW